MRIISFGYFDHINVSALSQAISGFTTEFCIAYKPQSLSHTYVVTGSAAIVDYLLETNPNCRELFLSQPSLEKKLKGFEFSNPGYFRLALANLSNVT